MGQNYNNNLFPFLFDELIYIYNKIKEKNLKEIILIILVVPFMWFFILIYGVVYLYFLMYYNSYYIYKYFNRYVLKNNQKPLKYKLIKTQAENNFFIFLRIMLYDVPKQYAYNNTYNMLFIFKELKNKKNINSKISRLLNLVLIFIIKFIIKIIVRWLIIIIFNYSFFTIKTSIIFIESVLKVLKLNIKNKLALVQCIMFDFAEKYQHIYAEVKDKKIKFLKNEVKFNPLKNLKNADEFIKILKDKIISEINLSQSKLNDLLNAIENIREKLTITYSFFENIETGEKEKSSHTTAILPLNEEKSLTIRGTTKKLVEVIGFDENGDKISKNMYTHTLHEGWANNKFIEYKTDVIEIRTEDINVLFNPKFLINLQQNSQIKGVFFNGLINSLSKPVYLWEYGKLIEDPKYKNFIDKIEKDQFLTTDPIIKNSLELIKNIYIDNLEIIKHEKGDKVFDAIIQILILNKNNVYNKQYIEYIISLL